MRTPWLDKPDPAAGVAEGKQVLIHHLYADGRTVGLGKLARQQHRHPEAPKEVAHRSARARPRQHCIFGGFHVSLHTLRKFSVDPLTAVTQHNSSPRAQAAVRAQAFLAAIRPVTRHSEMLPPDM